ncbi:MAG: hypothetical protein BMS9Abin23_0042 [Thermodesulfobacteriota bacterium]|nr:MAG: hypothetical protein BMS9Abin23_0042 [Thermodesulfobacteriota bacterium]
MKDKRINIKIVLFVLFVFFLSAGYAAADLYKWVNEDGVVNMTDDLGKIPEKFRAGAKVYKVEPVEIKEKTSVPIAGAEIRRQRSGDLYGDHTLEWWEDQFSRIYEERDSLSADIEKKKTFIRIFEAGRRFGQTFGETDVANYRRYKKELSSDEKRLAEIEGELKDLRRKATYYGVPRTVRGK